MDTLSYSIESQLNANRVNSAYCHEEPPDPTFEDLITSLDFYLQITRDKNNKNTRLSQRHKVKKSRNLG